MAVSTGRHERIKPKQTQLLQLWFCAAVRRFSKIGVAFPGEASGESSGMDWVVRIRASAKVSPDNYGSYGEVDLSRSQLGSARPGGVKSGGRTHRPAKLVGKGDTDQKLAV